jgi:hypothetical protein
MEQQAQTETQAQTVDLFWFENEIQEPCHRRRRGKMGRKTQPQMQPQMQKDEKHSENQVTCDNQATCECGRIYNKSHRSKHMKRWP